MSASLILIGFKACGKTSVGRELALRLQTSFIDTDQLIEARYHVMSGVARTCPEIYRVEGGDQFRALEKTVIAALSQGELPGVIAVGGGAVLDSENVMVLRQLGSFIYLSASYSTLLTRLQAQSVPAYLNGDLETAFQAVFAEREPRYHDLADYELHTGQYSVADLADQLCDVYGGNNGKQ